ncbi:hypothetical protein QJS04_geneDACA001119 [Acorus gramineus]|uniref:Uncharacterized protein n=1 Tax=Acorus gramineus TaxID=55184 RepID=A0AAV9ACZ0_ACOGR|nr:hypothetical protein QJS04_geneDACA001119 [Acorus gramineus]
MAVEEENQVKKEMKVEDDDGTLSSFSISKKKPNGTPKSASPKPSKAKKEEPIEEEDAGDPKRGNHASTKSDKGVKVVKKKVKKMTEEVEEKNLVMKVKEGERKKKKEKKVYDLPGQKHEAPNERDPLRIFYESLYKQIPNSEMAAFWLMEWGLLSFDEAKKVYEKKIGKAQQLKLSSPVKAVSVKKTSTVSVKVTKVDSASKTTPKASKKRKANQSSDEDSDDDFTTTTKKVVKKQRASD